MKRMMRTAVLAVSCGLVMTGLGSTGLEASAQEASQRSQSVSAGSDLVLTHADGARKKKHKKKHKKKGKKRGNVNRCWPGLPSATTTRLPGAVRYNWATTSCTTRYRVHISPAWFGAWPGAAWYTPYVGSTARNTTYRVPATPRVGDGMIATAYANPVYGQLENNNSLNPYRVATHKSSWVASWPLAPAPKAGDPVRFGSYNVMLYPTGTRAAAVARNIGSHGLSMVALQEARQSTAAGIVNQLNSLYGGGWTYVNANGSSEYTPGQQIIYRSDSFSLATSGVINAANPKDSGNRVIAPYAGFRAIRSGGALGDLFYVTSVHFAGTATSSLAQNAITGAAARVVSDYMSRLTTAPVIAAGDMRYGREPWGDRAGYVPAQPTFVRSGYYDAMATQSMHGQGYGTFNAQKHQTPHPSGAGPRSDHILMKGIVGSRSFTNVANWSYGGVIPSDHNLIYSDIMIPPAS